MLHENCPQDLVDGKTRRAPHVGTSVSMVFADMRTTDVSLTTIPLPEVGKPVNASTLRMLASVSLPTYQLTTPSIGNTMASNENAQNKRFNAESPSFTPLQPQGNGLQPTRISPRSAQAAPFTPKSNKPSKLIYVIRFINLR